ncbi:MULTISPECIES: hypothetical protein [unclassified Oceanispirochaeta]|uniref:hypothetical protein n=1 Tax=unclassified Oceanispirochaeta TaxID=2635722 RepID=UPI000E08F77E|nr:MULTISPECIES: hypothetical protein [unclassified Oceanispirochaeta]MBF9014046.1 hypothetical protein [Oceanispirochaeta sp. M2]NPD70537.1 hypothetical protein [Oceanispirochaeta sp. M1]RDG34305.1 hypothetical protein DV872_00375 [Oceanispirochaeta sp. M1]
MKKIVFILCIQVLTLSMIQAQDSSKRISIISSLASSDVPEQKVEALRSIENILNESSMGEDEAAILNILSNLSSEGITNVKRSKGVIQNDFPAIRLEAVRLLGKTESPDAMKILVGVLKNDNNLTVISEASLTAAGLESASWAALVPYYFRIIKLQKEAYRNNQLIQDVLTAIRIIADRDESILNDPKIMEGIVFIAEENQGLSKRTVSLADELKTRKLAE